MRTATQELLFGLPLWAWLVLLLVILLIALFRVSPSAEAAL